MTGWIEISFIDERDPLYILGRPEGGVVLMCLVSDRPELAVPQALIDDTLAFHAHLDSRGPDEVRRLIQGFARTMGSGCPWGSPPGCCCATCYDH